MRRTLAMVAVAASLFAGGTPVHADDVVDPDPATTVGQNSGEGGFQTVTINVKLPEGRYGETSDATTKIAGDCEYEPVGIPDTNQSVLTVVAHATSIPSSVNGIPVGTGVKCRVFNANGGVTIDRAQSGNTIALPGQDTVRNGLFTICVTISVYWDSNVFTRSPEVCRTPQ